VCYTQQPSLTPQSNCRHAPYQQRCPNASPGPTATPNNPFCPADRAANQTASTVRAFNATCAGRQVMSRGGYTCMQHGSTVSALPLQGCVHANSHKLRPSHSTEPVQQAVTGLALRVATCVTTTHQRNTHCRRSPTLTHLASCCSHPCRLAALVDEEPDRHTTAGQHDSRSQHEDSTA
jgi:hypothetical protein